MAKTLEYKVLRDRDANEYLNQKKVEGKYLIGLEVIEPGFQVQLDKNIDPQHTDNTTKSTDTSAIDFVLNNIETILGEVAGRDICMLTSKADLDSIGAMTILTMALEGKFDEIKAQEVIDRVAEVNKYDNFTTAERWQRMSVEDAVQTNKQFGAINTAVIDFKTSIADRIKIMEEWLKSGVQPAKYVLEHEREIITINKSIEDASTTIDLKEGVAIVKSNYFKAPQIGYSEAPAVIAYNPEFKQPGKEETQLKFTIAQFPGENVLKLGEIKEALNTKDPFVVVPNNTWGGPANLLASPMSTGTGLSVDEVIEIVLAGVD